MEEKTLGPFVFIAGMVAAVGIFKAKRFVQPALTNTRVFFAEKKEHLEDLLARAKTKRQKNKRH